MPRIRPSKPFPVARELSPTREKRKRRHIEESDELPPTINQRNVRPRSAEPPERNSPSELMNYPLLDINPRDILQGGQHQEASSPLLTPQSGATSPDPPNALKRPNQTIAQPRTDGEHAATLTEVNPDSGSITGGARIWLRGVDFPANFPLYARFGTAVVPTVSPLTCLWCFLTAFFRFSAILAFFSAFCLL